MVGPVLSACISIILFPLLYFIYKTMTRPKNFPPGPFALPGIGNFHQLAPLYKRLPELAAVHGDIFSVKMSTSNAICINGFDLIKEVISDRTREFCDRYHNIIQKIVRGEELEGIVAAEGPKWVAHRKFFFSAFRSMGLNRSGIEKRITDELPAIIQELEEKCRKGVFFDPAFILDCATLNVLASFALGDRYEYTSPKFRELLDINNAFFKNVNVIHQPFFLFYNQIPYLYRFWLPWSTMKVVEPMRKIKDFIAAEIDHHKKLLDPHNPRDFIDYYLLEMKKGENIYLTEERLKITILDLFQAGTETIATTLRWALLYMANYPDIQSKVHKEIKEVIGLEREPKYDDKQSMPYCEATILETQRYATIIPTGILHTACQDTSIRGYSVPKGTVIIPSYYSLHHSPKHWKNPHEFDPGNFLEDDGSVGSRDAFFPFGGGSRLCVGMQLAKQELFLFFIGILQKFEVSRPPGVDFLCEEPVSGLSLSPMYCKLHFISRC